MKDTLPTVVLFGRTNVGKSSLFNRLRETRQALTADASGTTRDANAGPVTWRDTTFNLIDTGGIIDRRYFLGRRAADNDIDGQVQEKSRQALEKADAILFLVDARTGLTAEDRDLARYVRRFGHDRVILVANKADNPRLRAGIGAFVALGLGEALPVSAASGAGTGDLLDALLPRIHTGNPDADAEIAVHVAIVGAPNVGKSSLLNAFFREPRVIVSPIPHTTREPHDELLHYRGQNIRLIDTAGITRQGRKNVHDAIGRTDLKRQSIRRSLFAIDRSDLVLLVLDATAAPTREAGALAEHITASGRSVILVMNKYDLAKTRAPETLRRVLLGRLPSLAWAPVACVSALTGEKTAKLLDQILAAAAARKRTVTDRMLERFLKQAVANRPPAAYRGNIKPRIRNLTQVQSDPPTFSLRLGANVRLDSAYLTYLQNRLRDTFGYEGTPVTVYVDRKEKKPLGGSSGK